MKRQMPNSVLSTGNFLNSPWLLRPTTALVLVLGLQALSVPQSALAQNANDPAVISANATQATKKLITHDVYANWRSIQNSILSRDGQWAAYALVGQESDGEIVVKNLRDGREWRAPRGNAPVFSFDGKYLAFAVAPTRAELDKAKKAKTKPEDAPKAGVGVIDLASGTVESIERVKRFSFAEEGPSRLAVLLEPPKEVKKEAKKEGAPKADASVAEASAADEVATLSDTSDEDQQVMPGAMAAAASKRKKLALS